MRRVSGQSKRCPATEQWAPYKFPPPVSCLLDTLHWSATRLSRVRFTAARDPMGPLRRAWVVFLHGILRKLASLVRVVASGFRLCLSLGETLELFSGGNQHCSVAENRPHRVLINGWKIFDEFLYVWIPSTPLASWNTVIIYTKMAVLSQHTHTQKIKKNQY